jgi:hypothetical protein
VEYSNVFSSYVALEAEENHKYVGEYYCEIWRSVVCFTSQKTVMLSVTAERTGNVTTNICSQDSQPRDQEETRHSLNMKQACQMLETVPSVFGDMSDTILQFSRGAQ